MTVARGTCRVRGVAKSVHGVTQERLDRSCLTFAPAGRGVADGGGGVGDVLTPLLKTGGVDPRTFYDVIIFALNFINIKKTMKILMLVKSILSKGEINLTAPKKQRKFVPPILATTLMRR